MPSDCLEELLTSMDTGTASDGEESSSPDCIESSEFCYGRGTPPRILTVQDRPGNFGNNKSVKRGDKEANQPGDGMTETQPGAAKSGTKRAAEGKKPSPSKLKHAPLTEVDEPETASPPRRRRIQRMTFEERESNFNHGVSFFTRLFNDIDIGILEMDDWELRLTYFSAEAVEELTEATERIIEDCGLKYNPRGDIRRLRAGWRRIIRGGRELGCTKESRRRLVRVWWNLSWGSESQRRGWQEIECGRMEIWEVLRRMEAALLGKKEWSSHQCG